MVIDPAQTETLEITGHCDDGLAGTDSSVDNPLRRALDSLLTTGRPFGRFHACYLNPRPLAHGATWFGTFVHSAGDRLIYFPGFAQMHQHVQTAKGQSPVLQQAFETDHVSLDADRHTWHLTTRGSTEHVGAAADEASPQPTWAMGACCGLE